MKPSVLYMGMASLLFVACAHPIQAIRQTSVVSPQPQAPPKAPVYPSADETEASPKNHYQREPIARVEKMFGKKRAFLRPFAKSNQKVPLRVGMEPSLRDVIEVGTETQVSLSVGSDVNIRLDENTEGMLRLMELPPAVDLWRQNPEYALTPTLVFALTHGKILVQSYPMGSKIAVRTPELDVTPAGTIYLVTHREQHSAIGVLEGAINATLVGQSASTWSVCLAPGTQLLPKQANRPFSIESITTASHPNNFPIAQNLRQDPLVRLQPFERKGNFLRGLKELNDWKARQQHRWAKDYTRYRDRLCRDLKFHSSTIPLPPKQIIHRQGETREIGTVKLTP